MQSRDTSKLSFDNRLNSRKVCVCVVVVPVCCAISVLLYSHRAPVQVLANTDEGLQQGGFWCDVCECTLRDSQAYLSHINGKRRACRACCSGCAPCARAVVTLS